jgi:D-glycero-D-manno-heptose 1,7-bisphosphate phosphatase
MNRAILFDRDGIINELVERADGSKTAPWFLDEFKFTENIKMAVDIVRNMNYKTFVVTNQPDVNNGPLDLKDLIFMHKTISHFLRIDDIYYSEDRNSNMYKPKNGMIEEIIKKYLIDRSESYIIGDRWKDIVAGNRSNLKTIFVGEEYTYPYEFRNIKPDYIVSNVLEACTLIKEINK